MPSVLAEILFYHYRVGTVSGMNNNRLGDKVIWKFAKDHNYIIVTYDEDFYE